MISRVAGTFGDYDLDEISMLAMKAKRDRSIITELWNRIYKLVVSSCNDFWKDSGYASRRCELDDLIQESYLYFEKAIKNFEPDRGMKFSTYLMMHIKSACRSAAGGLTVKRQNDPIFNCASLDAPIKEGEDTTLGEIIPDESSGADYSEIIESDAVKTILEQIDKISGGMHRYCFLEYAYYDHSIAEIARKVHVTPPAIKHHIECAAEQLRKNPIIKSTYPEKYVKELYYKSDYSHKGLNAFLSTGTSVVEDIVNRKITIDNIIRRAKENNVESRKKD